MQLYIIIEADDEDTFSGALLGPEGFDIGLLIREFKAYVYSSLGGTLNIRSWPVERRIGDMHCRPRYWEMPHALNREQLKLAREMGIPTYCRTTDGTYTILSYGKEWVDRFFQWLVDERGFRKLDEPVSLWAITITGC